MSNYLKDLVRAERERQKQVKPRQGYWGIFEWRGDGKYKREDALDGKIYKSERKAGIAREGMAGNEMLVVREVI